MKEEISWWDAEQILGYTPRHMRRLRSMLLKDGPKALRDKRAGRKLNRSQTTFCCLNFAGVRNAAAVTTLNESGFVVA